MEMESIIINNINSSGEVRSLAMEAIGVCKKVDYHNLEVFKDLGLTGLR